MTTYAFPRKPYDEVVSEFIRKEIRQGSFDDPEYRCYVNELVWLEWYTTEGRRTITGGISRLGAAVHRRKVAAVHPEAYDAIRRDLGASTRTEEGWHWQGEEDPDERRQWARRHSEEWQAVQRGEQRPPAARAELTTGSSRPFAPFRFPVLPYDSIQSPFVHGEIRRGSFDDFEYRRTVNKLAWLEWDATARNRGGYYGTPVKRWHIAAETHRSSISFAANSAKKHVIPLSCGAVLVTEVTMPRPLHGSTSARGRRSRREEDDSR